MDFLNKYLKYKNKYLNKLKGGFNCSSNQYYDKDKQKCECDYYLDDKKCLSYEESLLFKNEQISSTYLIEKKNR